MGAACSALKKASVGPTDVILVNGISGMQGVSCAIFGPVRGAKKILGTGRDKALLEEIKAPAPHRIEVRSINDGPVEDRTRGFAEGRAGVDACIDRNGPGAAQETFQQGLKALRRGGVAVDIGAATGEIPIDVQCMMGANRRLIGPAWFATHEGREMADMVGAGAADFSILETQACPLSDVAEAISGIAVRHGGFSNFVIHP